MNRLTISLLLLTILFTTSVAYAQQHKILIPYRIGKAWGYSDTLGKLQLPAVYDSVNLFTGFTINNTDYRIATAGKGGRMGVIDDAGNVIVPFRFAAVQPTYDMNGGSYFVTQLPTGKKGVYIGVKEIITAVYDEVQNPVNSSFVVTLKNKKGLFTQSGKLLIPVHYNLITPVGIKGGWLSWEASTASKKVIYKEKTSLPDEDFGYITGPPSLEMLDETLVNNYGEDEKLLRKQMDSIKVVYGLHGVSTSVVSNFPRILAGRLYKSGKAGLYFPLYGTIIPPVYDDGFAGFLPVMESYQQQLKSRLLIAGSKAERFGIMNEKGEPVVPFEFDAIELIDSHFILTKDGKQGALIPHTIYPPIKPLYKSLKLTENIPVTGNWAFSLFKATTNGGWGYVGENGVEYFRE